MTRTLYFVDRGRDCPEWHKAPYHRYLLCTERARAYWEAEGTREGAFIWERPSVTDDGCGWLLLRWRGLDIDYGHVVGGCILPDGTSAGFVHPHTELPPWNVLKYAVWWSEKTMPRWIELLGVAPPADSFSRRRIHEGDLPQRPRRQRYVWLGEEVVALSDWLEERGFMEAAQAFRRELLPRENDQPHLFKEML